MLKNKKKISTILREKKKWVEFLLLEICRHSNTDKTSYYLLSLKYYLTFHLVQILGQPGYSKICSHK